MIRKKQAKKELIREIVKLVGKRAQNIYDARKLCCSESLLFTLNQGFRGELAQIDQHDRS